MPPQITVFLVDDDIDDQEILSCIMEDAFDHATCVFANDGVHALEKLKSNAVNPDIIFVDINMPRMNGKEFLTELKKLPEISRIPVFMYSTSDEQEIVAECKRLGASGFIKKYADTDEVKKELQKVINSLTTT